MISWPAMDMNSLTHAAESIAIDHVATEAGTNVGTISVFAVMFTVTQAFETFIFL